MHILVVDDFTAAADSLAELLTELGHTVSVAYSGTDALESMRAQPPDLAFLDLNLPGLDGWQVAEAMRGDGNECYLVALTGSRVPGYVARAARAGCDTYVVKPIAAADLERAIALAERRRSGHLPRHHHRSVQTPA